MKYHIVASLVVLSLSTITTHPNPYNPYYKLFQYNQPHINYANNPFLTPYSNSYIDDPVITSYLSTPDTLPTLNILAEVPYSITNRFTVVPMLVVSRDNMNMVKDAQIVSVSKRQPTMIVKTNQDNQIQCTPAVKIVLDRPITVYTLKSNVFFPSQIKILHRGVRLPINVGAVIAPVTGHTYVSTETPVAIKIVYAVPTKPISFDYVNYDNDIIDVPDTQAVIVESEPNLSPPNVTIIEFPDKEATPELIVDENDDELVNRNPPTFLAPAGIVQSTQPLTHVEPFTNSKESAVLIALREEAKKRL